MDFTFFSLRYTSILFFLCDLCLLIFGLCFVGLGEDSVLGFWGETGAEKLIKISHITKLAGALALFHRCPSQNFPLFLSSQMPCVAISYFDWLTVVHFSTNRKGGVFPHVCDTIYCNPTIIMSISQQSNDPLDSGTCVVTYTST